MCFKLSLQISEASSPQGEKGEGAVGTVLCILDKLGVIALEPVGLEISEAFTSGLDSRAPDDHYRADDQAEGDGSVDEVKDLSNAVADVVIDIGEAQKEHNEHR